MKTVKTIRGLQSTAMREGLSLLHGDGRTFNADGSISEAPRRLRPKIKDKKPEEAQGPRPENHDLSRIAEALERLPSQNPAVLEEPIFMVARVIDRNNKETMALLKEILVELTRLTKVMGKPPIQLIPESWEFEIDRTPGGFIDKISAKPVYRPMIKN